MRHTISLRQRKGAQVFPLLTMLLIMTGGMPAPQCSATSTGQVACMDGRLCRCGFERGGSITGQPDGHRWDCGALRPDCAPQSAATDPFKGRNPPMTLVPVVPLR